VGRASASPAATATWFDGPTGSLAGWLHLPPSGSAHGGVVLCRPLGRESIVTDRAMRVLANRICAAGLVALRFDYAGTGDSADSPDGIDGVTQWVDSIRAASEFLRHGGCTTLSLVGLRLGAVLASAAAEQCGPLTSLIGWDPVSGRTFLREQRALQALEIGPRPSSGDKSVGFTYAAPVAAELRTLDLGTSAEQIDFETPQAGRYLLLTRPQHGARAALAEMSSSPLVVLAEAPDQADLLERRSFAAVTPRQTIARIVEHLSKFAPPRATPVRFPVRDTAVVRYTPTGAPIVEQLSRIGPQRVFAVVTEPVHEDPDQPTLLLANVAEEPHIGPGRAWVDLAREAAGLGLRVLRVDRAGIGESGSGDEAVTLYAPGVRGEVIELGRWLRDNTRGPVGMVGSCSGAWEAAIAGGAVHLDAVWLINPAEWCKHPAPADAQAAGQLSEAIAAGLNLRAKPAARARFFVKRHLPYWLWLAICRANLGQTPEPLLADLARNATKVRLLLSPTDEAKFWERRGGEGLARLRGRGADIRITSVPSADHALFDRAGRQAVMAQVLADAVTDLVGSGATPPAGPSIGGQDDDVRDRTANPTNHLADARPIRPELDVLMENTSTGRRFDGTTSALSELRIEQTGGGR